MAAICGASGTTAGAAIAETEASKDAETATERISAADFFMMVVT
ncbi:hypothetical protein GCM10007086_41150 [Photobacterium aphoticum]|nr:hypothetical protein GCM10007086_41150 [Photobacterium aphoticum]